MDYEIDTGIFSDADKMPESRRLSLSRRRD